MEMVAKESVLVACTGQETLTNRYLSHASHYHLAEASSNTIFHPYTCTDHIDASMYIYARHEILRV
jgi:hypothetical protein